MVEDYLEKKGRGEGKLGPDWLSGFLSRHKNIVVRKSEHLSVARIPSLTEEVGKKWMDLLEDMFTKYNITTPDQIHNCDETGMATDPSAGFVLAKKGSRVYSAIGGSGRGQIFILGRCSAAGKIWPPFVVYKAKKLNVLWTEDGHPGATYSCTDSGWMEAKPFASWFMKDFVPKVQNVPGSKVLIFDGHNSHISIELIETAIKNKIALLRLSAHSSDVLQPLDVCVYGPLKKHGKKFLMIGNEGTALKKAIKQHFPFF